MNDFTPPSLLAALRARRPLVQNITNTVVTNFTANVLLAVGASPAMVDAREEVEAFVRISNALVVNIGTLNAMTVDSMMAATRAARAAGVPWVLDPVGAGATPWRTGVAVDLLGHAPAVVRANPGEVLALTGGRDPTQSGVDSGAGSDAALGPVRMLVGSWKTTVAVTGATDRIVTAGREDSVEGGHPMIQQVTGTGCATTALVGAFLAVAPAHEAAVAALTVMKRATERAAAIATGPGSLGMTLLDALSRLEPEDLE
jgi:hydroxyethylthiazole kinase